MSVRIVGPDWPSTRILREATAGIEGEIEVCWGVREGRDGALNGKSRRLNGYEQIQAFEKCGVAAPAALVDKKAVEFYLKDGHVFWGRKFFHTQGRDIVGARHKDFWRRDYWVEVIPNIVEEWRIHIFLGQCIARGKKVQVEEPRRKLAVRNRKNGWRMDHTVEPPKGLRSVAKAAVAALGYDFGAVDLAIDKDGKIWCFEVNTACGLDSYTATQYAKAIAQAAEK